MSAQSSQTATKIILTQTDPLARLKELCGQTNYTYKSTADVFENGILVVIKLMWPNFVLCCQESRFVRTDSLEEAQKTVCAILLDNLGLGPDDLSNEEQPEDEIIQENFAHGVLEMGMKMLGKVMKTHTTQEN